MQSSSASVRILLDILSCFLYCRKNIARYSTLQQENLIKFLWKAENNKFSSHSLGANWIRKLSEDKVIIIAAVVGIAIVLFLIVCIIIILLCRRKRMSEKCKEYFTFTFTKFHLLHLLFLAIYTLQNAIFVTVTQKKYFRFIRNILCVSPRQSFLSSLVLSVLFLEQQ